LPGFTCTVHQLEPSIGGAYRMSFRNFTTGLSESLRNLAKLVEPEITQ
jgi:hypothetical protein